MAILCATPAWARLPIGERVGHLAESAHPYGPGSPPGSLVWSESITHPGAVGMWVHFADIDLAPGDWVLVRDASGTETETLTGLGRQDLQTFWSRRVPGEQIVVELWSATATPGFGVVIDEYAWGYTPVSTQAVCGVNDLSDVVCAAGTDPDGYDRSESVARITVFADDGAVYTCTGARISSCGCDLLTTSGCITSATEASGANYEFLARSATCRAPFPAGCTGEGPPGVITSGTLTTRNPSTAGLDYSLINLSCFADGGIGNPRLSIDRRAPAAGWRIEIPQHAGGCYNQFGIVDTDAPSGLCEIESINQARCGNGPVLLIDNLRYTCDTDIGSSGAPVIAHDSHRLVGMHHCDERFFGCNGGAVPILDIMAEIQPLLGPLPDEVTGLRVEKVQSGPDVDLALRWDPTANTTDYRIYVGALPQPTLGTFLPGSYGHLVDEAALPSRGTCTTLGFTDFAFPTRGNGSPLEEDDLYFLVVATSCRGEGPFGMAPINGYANPLEPIPPGLGCR